MSDTTLDRIDEYDRRYMRNRLVTSEELAANPNRLLRAVRVGGYAVFVYMDPEHNPDAVMLSLERYSELINKEQQLDELGKE